MSKAENRHYTRKWKEKRKNHDGDKCDNAKCGICAAHKSHGNSLKHAKRKHIQEKELLNFEINQNI